MRERHPRHEFIIYSDSESIVVKFGADAEPRNAKTRCINFVACVADYLDSHKSDVLIEGARKCFFDVYLFSERIEIGRPLGMRG